MLNNNNSDSRVNISDINASANTVLHSIAGIHAIVARIEAAVKQIQVERDKAVQHVRQEQVVSLNRIRQEQNVAISRIRQEQNAAIAAIRAVASSFASSAVGESDRRNISDSRDNQNDGRTRGGR
jgi:hypothetical protein